MNIEAQSFGQLVRERRNALDLTQEELADRAGCTTISVRRIEASTLRPSAQLAEQLADVLQIPIDTRPDFIKLGRAVSTEKEVPEEKLISANMIVEQGMDARMWQHTEYLLPQLPLFFMAIVLVINPHYLAELTAIEQPFIIVNVLPCGWLVFAIVIALMLLSKVVLQNGRRGQGKKWQVYYRTGLNGFVLLFMTLPALLLLLLAPALFQAIRRGLWGS